MRGGEVPIPSDSQGLRLRKVSSMVNVKKPVSNNVGTQMPISCLQTPCTSNFPELCEMSHPQALTSEGRPCAWFPHPPKSILSHIILRNLSFPVGNATQGLWFSTVGDFAPR